MSDIVVKLSAIRAVEKLRKPGYLEAVMAAGREIRNAAGDVVALGVPPMKYHALRRDYALKEDIGKISDPAWESFRVAFLNLSQPPWFEGCDELREEMATALADLGPGCAGCKLGSVRLKFARKAWDLYQKSLVASDCPVC